ncbi:putative phosphoesterase YjcG [Paenibacillus sp. J31TS4]|uniref:2'-5' RNA ligase family protein n=1 Tax=Paenibacillus sp. J31TS4 TaxID=2807195 RepID=UPI001B238B8B|nr:2'-5' RNA ligase family protein [Paenibacillus sp. J31TS4]GIP39708.1 putative phosphoesterase YjcG [Paenibacillus sp. J31TS4]
MKYGIVVFPSKDIQDLANSYRKRYDPHYDRIPPHLTVRDAEEWEEGRLEEAVRHLEQTVSGLSPFPVTFNRFSSFAPVANVIYLATEDPSKLTALHDAVCSGPLAVKEQSYHYVPHVTVGQKLGDDEFHDVLSSLKNASVSETFQIDRLHLLYQMDNGGWTVYQTFLLGK